MLTERLLLKATRLAPRGSDLLFIRLMEFGPCIGVTIEKRGNPVGIKPLLFLPVPSPLRRLPDLVGNLVRMLLLNARRRFSFVFLAARDGPFCTRRNRHGLRCRLMVTEKVAVFSPRSLLLSWR